MFRHGGAGDGEAQGSAFAGLTREPIDQRLLARGEAGGAARGTGGAVEEDGISDFAWSEAAGPVNPRGEDFAVVREDRAVFGDPFLDQPLRQWRIRRL
jgi:hypothetical protein